MTTHSSILAWIVPRAEEPDGLQSKGSQRVRCDRARPLQFVKRWTRHRSTGQVNTPEAGYAKEDSPRCFFPLFFLTKR